MLLLLLPYFMVNKVLCASLDRP